MMNLRLLLLVVYVIVRVMGTAVFTATTVASIATVLMIAYVTLCFVDLGFLIYESCSNKRLERQSFYAAVNA